LVKEGADINHVNSYDDSILSDILYEVLDGYDLKYIRLLIELGADVNWKPYDGCGVLFAAYVSRSADAVKLLLDSGANPNFLFRDYNESFLDYVNNEQIDYEKESKIPICNNVDPEDKEIAEDLKKIVEVLRNYGAKTTKELTNENAN